MSNERAKLLTPEAKEMYSALYCLNLEVVPSIAEDVKAKVLAAVYAERQASRVAALEEAVNSIKFLIIERGSCTNLCHRDCIDEIRSLAEAPVREKS